MNYKEKQKSFRQRLKNQVKTIWISKEIATVPHPTLEKQFIKVVRLVKGTYNKSIHGLIGSDLIGLEKTVNK